MVTVEELRARVRAEIPVVKKVRVIEEERAAAEAVAQRRYEEEQAAYEEAKAEEERRAAEFEAKKFPVYSHGRMIGYAASYEEQREMQVAYKAKVREAELEYVEKKAPLLVGERVFPEFEPFPEEMVTIAERVTPSAPPPEFVTVPEVKEIPITVEARREVIREQLRQKLGKEPSEFLVKGEEIIRRVIGEGGTAYSPELQKLIPKYIEEEEEIPKEVIPFGSPVFVRRQFDILGKKYEDLVAKIAVPYAEKLEETRKFLEDVRKLEEQSGVKVDLPMVFPKITEEAGKIGLMPSPIKIDWGTIFMIKAFSSLFARGVAAKKKAKAKLEIKKGKLAKPKISKSDVIESLKAKKGVNTRIEDVRKVMEGLKRFSPKTRAKYLKDMLEIWKQSYGAEYNRVMTEYLAQEGYGVVQPREIDIKIGLEIEKLPTAALEKPARIMALEFLKSEPIFKIKEVPPVKIKKLPEVKPIGVPEMLGIKPVEVPALAISPLFAVDIKVSAAEKARQATAQKALQQQQQKILQRQKAAQAEVAKQAQRAAQAIKAAQALREAQALKQEQALKKAQVLRSKLLRPLKAPPKVPPPFYIGMEDTAARRRRVKELLKRARAYQVLVKRKGEYVTLTGVFPKAKAIKIGEKIALATLAASFKIQPTPLYVTAKEEEYEPSPVFRAYKLLKGRRIPLETEWIQRAKYRLAAKTEVREIMAARRRARSAESILMIKPQKQKAGGKGWF